MTGMVISRLLILLVFIMKVYVKNMICKGVKNSVLLELVNLDIKYSKFELGEIEFEDDLSLSDIKRLNDSISKYGLSLVVRKSRVVEKIRKAVLDLVNHNLTLKTSFSYYISNSVGNNYTYLSKYFKEEMGMSIEEYFIEKRIEQMEYNEAAWSDAVSQFR
jgi:AraC family transcriptional regulator